MLYHLLALHATCHNPRALQKLPPESSISGDALHHCKILTKKFLLLLQGKCMKGFPKHSHSWVCRSVVSLIHSALLKHRKSHHFIWHYKAKTKQNPDPTSSGVWHQINVWRLQNGAQDGSWAIARLKDPAKGLPSNMWKAGARLVALQLFTCVTRNPGVPVHRLDSRTRSCALHCKATSTAEAETEQVTCRSTDSERVQLLLCVQTPLCTLGSVLFALVQWSEFSHRWRPWLCLFPSVLGFIHKNSRGQSFSSVLSHLEFPPWSLSVAGQPSKKLFIWKMARCTRTIKKDICGLPHLMSQASAHLMQLHNAGTCEKGEEYNKSKALPPPVLPSCSYCFQLSWPWALWAGRVPGLSLHTLSGSQWKRPCTTHGWRGWRCNLRRLQQILP